jgi:hypothetical protein
MGQQHHHERSGPDNLPPRAAWLTAYLDGELGPEELARFEVWLSDNPGARAEIETERQLRDLFHIGRVPEPSHSDWNETLGRIEARVRGSRGSGFRRPRDFRFRGGALLLWVGAAAAVIAGIWIGANLLSPGPRPDEPDKGPETTALAVAEESDIVIEDMYPGDRRLLVVGRVPADLLGELLGRTPLEVADDAEIAVITMEGDDTGMLVVGEPPITGPLLLASPGEVRVDHILTGQNHPRPYMHDEGGGMPMLMIPQKTVRRD